jgi:TatD DNase family protein
VVTFKNSNQNKIINAIPLQHIVLETDAPYLTPVPFRGQRNESAYIRIIAEHIANQTNMPLETVADITTKNASTVFKKNITS